MADDNFGPPNSWSPPSFATSFGLARFGAGQYGVLLYPNFFPPQRDFFVSSLNGTGGPGDVLGPRLRSFGFDVNVYDYVAPNSLTWADKAAQGLNFWQTITRNGAAGEAESGRLARDAGWG
jgi:hypothetical protein